MERLLFGEPGWGGMGVIPILIVNSGAVEREDVSK
jgi:hypothetical protein